MIYSKSLVKSIFRKFKPIEIETSWFYYVKNSIHIKTSSVFALIRQHANAL